MNQTKIEQIAARYMKHWTPPPSLKLDQWADENIVLPETQNARAGHYRTWPYLREPLEAIGAKTPKYVSINRRRASPRRPWPSARAAGRRSRKSSSQSSSSGVAGGP